MSTELDLPDVEGLSGPASCLDALTDRVVTGAGYEHAVRWRPGERLDHLFEDRCDRMRHSGRPAVDVGDTVVTYDQLDARANQLARHLLARGVRPGDRIGLLFDHAVHSYVGMLAVLKINAAYVPLDVGFPPDRVSYIVGDAGVRMVLSLSQVRARMPGLEDLGAELVFVDEVADQVAQHDVRRLTGVERGDPVDELCYVIYTSGSTGRPKGVAVEHASICNFVRVAVEVYGIGPRDRVYQGMTIAFDFSVEEIWVPLLAGATLVPKPGGSSLLGEELREFLQDNEVTALCCVPTLLATLEEDLPGLRFLLVSGEACPQDLIARWHRADRRFLNVYGPTEATVTATWTALHPDRPVTIGVPLPTYSAVILDPTGEQRALLPGEVGEIGIAGIGLARGYLNRDDLTDRAFIRDFLGIDNNPSGRIYRTGDLGWINDDGEIEYHGRIDTQVKIRGYRVELTEIESPLQVPGIAQAVVDTYEPSGVEILTESNLDTCYAESDAPIGGAVLTRPPTSSEVRVLQQYFEQGCDRHPDAVAVICGTTRLTYAELDRRANRLARLLRQRDVAAGVSVGILLERSVETYVALLGVLKSGAAYVPLDHSFPDDRMAFIAEDAGLRHLVTTSASRDRTQAIDCPVLELDVAQPDLGAQSDSRPGVDIDPSSLCYVIYTSGSTGKPKGVAVSHASIVNFLRVATPIYGVTDEDLVYQGMSISFDFHLEEIWPAWVAGATLIAGPTDSNRFGQGLTDFLTEHQVTVFCSVPTLLTTVESDLPSVRCLLMSGEAMPPDLVSRFSRPGRRILNCYGPTETTVSSSCAELRPDRPVTLGVPFPTYEFYILDDQLRPVGQGETGEICIGGPGVAVGYLNRPELTAERFVPNPIAADRARAPRIYRTGDLGRCTPTGEFEYLGRIDTQVKMRGYRIELGEIEQIIREDPAVENAVVATTEHDGVVQDLVGYVTVHDQTHNGNGSSNGSHNGDGDLRERLHTTLRRRLPPYMIPSYIEVLDRFPLLAADKVDRARLPAPVSAPLGSGSRPHVPAETALEADIARTWGEKLGFGEVSVEDDFFDLGGHSMTAARVISALRERPGLQNLSMRDLYAHPTVRSLAEYAETALAVPSPDSAADSAVAEQPAPLRHSNLRVLSCGVAQLIILYLWLLLLGTPALMLGYAVQLHLHIFSDAIPDEGPLAAVAQLEILPLAILAIAWFTIVLFLLPVVGSRLVMRGIRPGWYPLWGLTYLRFWFFGKVIAMAPLALFAGSPMLPSYLRLLGAKVGRHSHLSTGLISVPPLVEIGDGTSIGFATRVQSYVVQDGWLRLAPIRIGADSFVGNNSLILPGAEIGDGASVGDQSLVHADHRIASHEHWAGSPINRLKTVPPLLETMTERADDRPWRSSVLFGYTAAALLLRLLPWVMAVPGVLIVLYVTATRGVAWGLSSALVVAPLDVLITCLLLVITKRAAMSRVEPGIYPSRGGFGVRQWLSNHVVLMSVALISTVYCTLYVIPFLRRLGLRLGRWSEVATPTFIDPDLTVIGDQSFLAGGVVTAPATYHRGCMALAPAEMGSGSFLGNEALLPCASRMGDNSLLGVFSVPPARPMDPETTWLGSPAFFLPRREPSQKFPAKYIDAPTPGLIAGRLGIEYFRVALPEIILLLSGLLGLYVLTKLALLVPPLVLLALVPVVGWGFGLADTLVVVLLKWIIMGRYRPRTEPYWGLWVRGTELITGLFEAVAVRSLLGFLTGTPWIAPVLRMFGTHVGRRVWLNSTALTEFDLVHIGDDTAIGEQGDMLTHLFEDRVMKMSHVRIGAGATVGTRSVVLYDAEIGAGAFLDAYSLVMKGEVLPPQSRWRGIPAVRCAAPDRP